MCEERSNRRWALEKGRRRRVDTEGAVEVGPIGPVSPSRPQKGEADPRSPSSAPRTENSAHYLLYFTLFLPPFANASVTFSGHTMFALVSLLALAASAAALQVTQPSNSSGWTISGPNTVTWSSVNTDKSNFTIVLNNQVSYAFSQHRTSASHTPSVLHRTRTPRTRRFLIRLSRPVRALSQ